jgi:signal transduction histidine kinase
MAAIGQLAAGVAHEINNPIGFVSSNLSTLRRYATQLLEVIDACGDCAAADASLASKFAAISNQVRLSHLRDDLPALLDETRDGLDRVKHIVQALQDFAHADSGEKHATDLVAGLRNTLEIAENQIAQRAEIRCELTPLPAVRCSPGLINQVFESAGQRRAIDGAAGSYAAQRV